MLTIDLLGLQNFSIRRGRVPGFGYDSDGCALGRQNLTTPVRGISPRPNGSSMCSSNGMPPILPTNAFSRNDGGRFSLRMSKSRTPVAQVGVGGISYCIYTQMIRVYKSH
jgi:hypothetical protein